jgi:hypothetical protein
MARREQLIEQVVEPDLEHLDLGRMQCSWVGSYWAVV